MQELCPAQEIPQQVGGEPTISMTALLELLKDADLMQKRALIAMQYSALHNRTWITPTVQKPCRNRALMAHKIKKP